MDKKIKQFLKQELKPHYEKFWGKKVLVKPELISAIQGDGLQIVYLMPMDTRPQYYVLRIDSKIKLTNEGDDEHPDYCEMLLEMIEDEYINIDLYTEKENGKYYDPDDKDLKPFDFKFPMLQWSGGSWGCIKNFKCGGER